MHYDALKTSEAQQQQEHFTLRAQLYQKEQQISQLLQKLQEALDSKQTALRLTTGVEQVRYWFILLAQCTEIKS